MKKKILVTDTPWQTRAAIISNGRLVGVFFQPHAHKQLEGSYFKGTVSAILPGIQTAFVDFGQERAGFLHISEIDRELAIQRLGLDEDEEGKRHRRTPREQMDISKILRKGEDILVQVSKEPRRGKGAKLTTCFTLPGRFLVLLPNIPRIAISKKIADRTERARLKEIAGRRLPKGMGAIIRTSSENKTENEIVKDIAFLKHNWTSIEKRFSRAEPNEILHKDLDIGQQMVRDHLDESVESVLVDSKEVQKQMYNLAKGISPEHAHKIALYEHEIPLFDYYEIEQQIEDSLEKKVELKSGGSIVIEHTEAMTVIDVNTGKFTGKSSMEDTILKTNTEAGDEIARQLRLRNIGGLIVIDFIDMATNTNRQKMFRAFEQALREYDRYQASVLGISEFGLVQMTRKRTGKTLIQELMALCQVCQGHGYIKSVAAESYAILHRIKETLRAGAVKGDLSLTVNPDMFEYLTSIEYNTLLTLEKQHKCKIMLTASDRLETHQYELEHA